ncbi:unnamed protein product [Parnassius apollo]|uniref:(apollo) hypothetical protein n=1 Tax=Parnassius apollo TaxID=110799 RepID=A0A8S3WZH2_PARAO|nr:unnamed protein product [Parnassius apollo]
MISSKLHIKRSRLGAHVVHTPRRTCSVDKTLSSPEFEHSKLPKVHKKYEQVRREVYCISPRSDFFASESNICNRSDSKIDENFRLEKQSAQGDDKSPTASHSESMQNLPYSRCVKTLLHPRNLEIETQKIHESQKQDKTAKCCSPFAVDVEDSLTRLLHDIHNENRKSARIIRDSKARLLNLQKKTSLNEADIKELGERNELLLREMERFDRLTKSIQKLVGAQVDQVRKSREKSPEHTDTMSRGPFAESNFEMKINTPRNFGGGRNFCTSGIPGGTIPRSKSEIDLTRKLTESYDMQEKLVADNADLEVKRYILYKELMNKDQNLETCRGQIKRLQGELKLLNIENSNLLEKLNKNNPEGDATAMTQCTPCHQEIIPQNQCGDIADIKSAQELVDKLEEYKTSTLEFEKQIGDLEYEVRFLRTEMDSITGEKNSACRGGGVAGPNTCFQQPPGGPPVPPMTKAVSITTYTEDRIESRSDNEFGTAV